MQSMKGAAEWRMETEDRKEEKGIFKIYGPSYLQNVDWKNSDHTRSIMGSLVKGVDTLEYDRQQKRTGDNALGPPWSNFFQFECIKTLTDQIDHSIFGAIYEYKPHAPSSHQGAPPGRYIIAFRGTNLEPEARDRDLYLDWLIFKDQGLTQDSRYLIAFQELNDMISKVGPRDVVLAGYSLGAAIALQAGKAKAKMGCLIASYLFNPPYPRIVWPDEKADNKRQQNDDSFKLLCSWIPNLFANPDDVVSMGYINYFEQRDESKETLSPDARGRDGEPSFLIPSALLTKNMTPMNAYHELDQWWKQHSKLQTKLYKYTGNK